MANYYGAFRSNYFKVTDVDKLRKTMQPIFEEENNEGV